jgi:REP element-mobilizing transposase RayT
MTLFKNKYRIESTRLKGWDYSAAGYYFVTICTKERRCFFGDVVNGEMVLSPIGEIVAEEWQKTAQIRPNVAMDVWIIMPNHVHGIIVIYTPNVETSRWGVSTGDGTDRGVSTGDGTDRGVSTGDGTDRGVSTIKPGANPAWKPNSLGSIVNQIKSICTKRIWKTGFGDFGWQSRFYDRILRDETALQKVRQYILDNPKKWVMDKNNPSNIFM